MANTNKKKPGKKKNIEKKPSKKQEKKVDKTNRILLVIFLLLCVVVFVLATVLITQNAKHKNDKYDIKVPIIKEEIKKGIDIKINMDDVEKNQSKEYRIQTTNYIEDNINKEVIKYQIKVNAKKVDVELYSSKENYELLQGKKKVTNLRFGKNKKEKVTYTIKLIQRKDNAKNDFVNVKIVEE